MDEKFAAVATQAQPTKELAQWILEVPFGAFAYLVTKIPPELFQSHQQYIRSTTGGGKGSNCSVCRDQSKTWFVCLGCSAGSSNARAGYCRKNKTAVSKNHGDCYMAHLFHMAASLSAAE